MSLARAGSADGGTYATVEGRQDREGGEELVSFV